MTDSDASAAVLVTLLRVEGRAVVASLTRWVGDLGLAEDSVQDAVERALRSWPRDGLPDNPSGWLTRVARNRAIDIIRRENIRPERELGAMALDTAGSEAQPEQSAVRDDLLRLIFTCCHPALAPETQMSLSLKLLCGLSTSEVGAALLVSEGSMARRLTRAKDKIRLAGIPYRVPADHDLPARVDAVVATVYLLFNEGYSASSGNDLHRPDVAAEAIRLGRLLREVMPDDVSVLGVLALMLLQDARSPARTDSDGLPVLLRDQDRSLWRRDQINEGLALLGEALRRSPLTPDRYAVQGAIAGCHDVAPTYESTQWSAIVSWYDVLLRLQNTPVVRLNRAAALAETDGAVVVLDEIDRLPGLVNYPEWHASRAELLRRLERSEEAVLAYDRAIELEQNTAQREHLARRRASVR